MSEWELLPRVLGGFVIGVVLGAERERRGKVAGLRTHTLVCMASALLMSMSELAQQGAGTIVGDPVRMAQGVLAGIGFIGAGAIIRREDSVAGVTTAGLIWMAATLGLVVGAGYFILAAAGTLLTLLTTTLLGRLDRWLD